MEKGKNEIVVYQPNETVRLEVRLAHDNARIGRPEDKTVRRPAKHDADIVGLKVRK